jgi:menaquinone-dependent protoporphyrinogen IX oxidase
MTSVGTQAPPRVLIVYYSFSNQTKRVADVIADSLGQRGAEVTRARIELTDTRWAKRFEQVPMRFPMLKLVGMLPAQIRRATGEIRIPPEARSGDYDLVVVGSPTWWFRLSIPIRSYLRSPAAKAVLGGKPFAGFSTSRRYWKHNVGDIKDLGQEAGGTWIEQTHFVAAGNQVQSMLAWLGFMSGFTYLDRILRLPSTNLQPGFEAQARQYAGRVADRALPGRLSAAAEAPAVEASTA